jgi:hydroxymethylglutaryl-CoA reductase (NADPH)
MKKSVIKLREFKLSSERRDALENHLGVDLQNTGSFSLNESVAGKLNCENMIGATQIPVGIAGPLRLRPESSVTKEYFVPLATTEGALVASVSRGCKAITESGGAGVSVEKVGATRGPVFRIKNLREKKMLEEFLNKNFKNLQKLVRKTGPHITLKKFDTTSAGHNFYIRFGFDTEDAMGMNMATFATQQITDFIFGKTGIKCLSLSGNYCIDKKPSWLNFTTGRGFKVWAEIVLPKEVLQRILKTSARNFYNVWLAKCMVGSAISGSMGFNAQFANIVAAIFLATGQDPAHIVEGSLGVTTAEVLEEDLYVSVYLPDLMVGTVGGGTGLATQEEALSILGIKGGSNGKNSEKLAEIIGAAVLAGEISLLSSLAEGSLVKAHKRLARGEKI